MCHTWRIAAHLAGRQYLLLLDNVERIQDAAPPMRDAGRFTSDPALRKQAYAQYQQRMTELLPMLFIGYDKVLLGANKRLQGMSVRPVGYDGNAFVENSHLLWLAP